MVGGAATAVSRLEPVFTALAPAEGYAHVGASGAGHFTKMVHNGIEYGLMQSYAEGFAVMEKSEFDLDLHEIAGRSLRLARSPVAPKMTSVVGSTGSRSRPSTSGFSAVAVMSSTS